jgi:hypothetical protein
VVWFVLNCCVVVLVVAVDFVVVVGAAAIVIVVVVSLFADIAVAVRFSSLVRLIVVLLLRCRVCLIVVTSFRQCPGRFHSRRRRHL